MNKVSVTKSEAITDRIAKYAEAFKSGQLQSHPAVSTYTKGDATGQRGWGPMMQT